MKTRRIRLILPMTLVFLAPLGTEAASITGLTPAPNPAPVGSQVNITITGAAGPCSKLDLDFGDGSGKVTPTNIAIPFATQHNYNKTGTFTLQASGKSGDCTGKGSAALTVNPAIGGPTPGGGGSAASLGGLKALAATCRIIDCTPKITSVFLFSVIQPGGGVVVFGEGFGGPRFPGQLRLKGLRRWDGAPVGDLALEDLSWDDTVVGGTIPWVTGVRDQDATLQVVTKAGASNEQKVRFTAARAPERLRNVQRAFCSDSGGRNSCWVDVTTIDGYHRGVFTTGAKGTDVYEDRLINNWVFKSYDWIVQKGVDGGFEGFRPESPNLYATVKWFYDASPDLSEAHYLLVIYIEGPADVPYR